MCRDPGDFREEAGFGLSLRHSISIGTEHGRAILDEGTSMTRTSRGCGRAQGDRSGRAGAVICAGGCQHQCGKVGWEQPLRAWKGRLGLTRSSGTAWTSSCPGPQGSGPSVTFRKPQPEVCDSFCINLAHVPGIWATQCSPRSITFIYSLLMYVTEQSWYVQT